MSGTAFFGKLPTAADFVRRGVSGAALRAFEHWFHDNYTELRGTGASGLAFECRVVFPIPGGEGVIAAVGVPSRDQIGRAFPAVVLTAVPKENLPASISALCLGLERFFSEAARAVEQHADEDADQLFDALASVPAPSRAELADAEQRGEALLGNIGAREMERECFTDSDDRFYAYQTLRLAVRDAPLPETRVVLCPCAKNAAYRLFWIATIERGTEHRVPLPILWLEGAEAPDGLLIALGKAAPGMLRYAVGHGRSSNTLWPLTTEREVAKERAKVALKDQDWTDPEQKLSRLIDDVLSIQV